MEGKKKKKKLRMGLLHKSKYAQFYDAHYISCYFNNSKGFYLLKVMIGLGRTGNMKKIWRNLI
ncbi:hypothetical protein ACS0TY_005618 [Phlomoides rotata]